MTERIVDYSLAGETAAGAIRDALQILELTVLIGPPRTPRDNGLLLLHLQKLRTRLEEALAMLQGMQP